MSKIFQIVVCGMICSLLVSCAFIDRYDPGFVQRSVNRRNLEYLKKDMSKQEVLGIMGESLIHEKYNKPNIWFYYTDWDWADAAITQSECTPLVFENDRLIGWGRDFYKDYIHKTWLFSGEKLFQKDSLGK